MTALGGEPLKSGTFRMLRLKPLLHGADFMKERSEPEADSLTFGALLTWRGSHSNS
jgi:hypothetical protein